MLLELHMAAGSSIGAAWFLSHEAGHNVQIQLGFTNAYSSAKGRELGADCLSGYFLAYEHCRGVYDMTEGMNLVYAICRAADPIATPWFQPGTHGTCEERVAAVQRGIDAYGTGTLPATACVF